jgi:hypothetical protein
MSSLADTMLQALGFGASPAPPPGPPPETVPTDGFIDVRRKTVMDPRVWDTPRVNNIVPGTLSGQLSFDPQVSKERIDNDTGWMKHAITTGGLEPTVPHGEYPENTAFRQEISDMIQKRPAFAEPRARSDQETLRDMQTSLNRKKTYMENERLWNEVGLPNEMKRLATTKMWQQPQRTKRSR